MNAIDTEKFMEDSKGRLVPIEQVKTIDIERSSLVKEIIADWKMLQFELKTFKNRVYGDIQAFVDLSAEQYGVKRGGKKGNVSLLSFDGKYKIQMAISDNVAFDEQIQAAKALIDECAAEWMQGSRSEIKAIINDAFRVDKEGQISVTQILGLRRLEIQDAKWLKAMEAISNSIHVIDSKSYIRAYERDKNGRWGAIPLDLAAL